jgi:hypothetical protein
MPGTTKSSFGRRKSPTAKKSSFGRRKSTTSKVSKNILMDVEIKMYFKDPFRTSSKSQWVTIPGMEMLKYNIAKQWYKRLILERFIKLIVIHGIQTCVRVCYGGQIPSWYRSRLGYTSSESTLNEYWSRTKRIVACFRLFSTEDAGFLLTDKSVLTAKTVNQLKFRTPEDLASECRFRDPVYSNVFSLLGLIDSNIGTPDRVAGGENSAIHEQKMQCKSIIASVIAMVNGVIQGDHQIMSAYGFNAASLISIQDIMRIILDVQRMRYNRTLSARNESELIDEEVVAQAPILTSSPTAQPAGQTKRTPTEPKAGQTKRSESAGSEILSPEELAAMMKQSLDADVEINKAEAAEAAAFAANKFGRSRFGQNASLVSATGFVKPYRISAMESYTGMTPSAYRKHIGARGATPTGTSRVNLARANNYYGSYRLGEELNPTARFGRKAAHDSDDSDDSEPRKVVRRKTAPKKKPLKRKSAASSTKKKLPVKRKSAVGTIKKKLATKRKVVKGKVVKGKVVKRKVVRKKTTEFGNFFF